jgi:hypothetical protein
MLSTRRSLRLHEPAASNVMSITDDALVALFVTTMLSYRHHTPSQASRMGKDARRAGCEYPAFGDQPSRAIGIITEKLRERKTPHGYSGFGKHRHG